MKNTQLYSLVFTVLQTIHKKIQTTPCDDMRLDLFIFFFHSQCDATTYTCIQTNIYTHTASYIHLKSNNNIIVKKKIENSALIVRTFENEAPLKNE